MRFSLCLSLMLLTLVDRAIGQSPSQEGSEAGIQIVNATSVPMINLYVNKELLYRDFAQGLYTGDAYVPYAAATYRAVLLTGNSSSKESEVTFVSNEKQTLLITGDFSTKDPPEELPQPPKPQTDQSTPAPPAKTYAPNVQFRILSHRLTSGESRLRYRFFNAIPSKAMAVMKGTDGNSSLILPGDEFVFSGQTNYENFLIAVEGIKMDVPIRQEGHERNCTIICFLRDGKPTFARIFENTSESDESAIEN